MKDKKILAFVTSVETGYALVSPLQQLVQMGAHITLVLAHHCIREFKEGGLNFDDRMTVILDDKHFTEQEMPGRARTPHDLLVLGMEVGERKDDDWRYPIAAQAISLKPEGVPVVIVEDMLQIHPCGTRSLWHYLNFGMDQSVRNMRETGRLKDIVASCITSTQAESWGGGQGLPPVAKITGNPVFDGHSLLLKDWESRRQRGREAVGGSDEDFYVVVEGRRGGSAEVLNMVEWGYKASGLPNKLHILFFPHPHASSLDIMTVRTFQESSFWKECGRTVKAGVFEKIEDVFPMIDRRGFIVPGNIRTQYRAELCNVSWFNIRTPSIFWDMMEEGWLPDGNSTCTTFEGIGKSFAQIVHPPVMPFRENELAAKRKYRYQEGAADRMMKVMQEACELVGV